MADIAIDFDGTCVFHCYPEVGADNPSAVEVLKKLYEHNHNLILYTMRSGKELNDAIKWFEDREIPLYAVNINPEQLSWTNSPKVCAALYIDDCGVGCPLLFDGIRS
ncbi:MAG: hypothetical protein WC554_14495, partial [Clostridia bacterium]